MKKLIKLLLFVFLFLSISITFADAKAVKKAQLKLIEKPKVQYNVGEIAVIKFNSGNFSGKVQYRVLVEDLNAKKSYELYKQKDKYYTGIFNSGKQIVTVRYKFLRAGNYRFTIYVKRAGVISYDSYLRTNIIKVNEKVVVKDTLEEDKNTGTTTGNETNSNPSNNQDNSSNSVVENKESENTENSNNNSEGNGDNPPSQENQNGGTISGPTNGTNPQVPVTIPENNGIIKSLNITLGNGSIVEGTISGTSYDFDLRNLMNEDTVLKINFILNSDGVIEISGRKFNAKKDQTLSINVPGDLGITDNPPPGITLASLRQYDSTFGLAFTVTTGSNKYNIGVNLKVK